MHASAVCEPPLNCTNPTTLPVRLEREHSRSVIAFFTCPGRHYMRRAYLVAGVAAVAVATAFLAVQPGHSSVTEKETRTNERETAKAAEKSQTAGLLPISQVVLF